MPYLIAFFFCLASAFCAQGANPGDSVVVVYNKRAPESKGVAEHYAKARQVPEAQVVGLDLPGVETMTRAEFREQLELPLLKLFTDNHWFSFAEEATPPEAKMPGNKAWVVTNATVRYAVLCYGVPLKIAPDPMLKETLPVDLRQELRRNEAAVDSELALLPISRNQPLLAGPAGNPAFSTTNLASIHPTNSVLMVARLDGPSAAIAKGLVDKALQAEKEGMWGRAYIDMRGLTNGPYLLGDQMMALTAEVCRIHGLETVVDKHSDTFGPTFPMSQTAIYAGWYTGTVDGPFANRSVEFMPGAFAYHLHSFSADTIRSTKANWVGPLLDAGATVTMGCVFEPYLEGTPDIGAFTGRFLIMGATFGEAAYCSQKTLSWMTTVVGDPLYRPFGRSPQVLHEALEKSGNPLVAWSHLRVINMLMAKKVAGPGKMLEYLNQIPETARSATLLEKMGDLYHDNANLLEAVAPYEMASKLKMSPAQRIRITLRLGFLLTNYGRSREAYELYEKCAESLPDHPAIPPVLRALIPLAEGLATPEKLAAHRAALAKFEHAPH